MDIFRTIMMTVTKMKTEILLMILFLLKNWYGRILTMILSYQTYQITTVVHMVWRKVWRRYFRLLLNTLCLPVVCRWDNSAG